MDCVLNRKLLAKFENIFTPFFNFFFLEIASGNTSKFKLMFAFSYFIRAVQHQLHQDLKIHSSSQNASCF